MPRGTGGDQGAEAIAFGDLPTDRHEALGPGEEAIHGGGHDAGGAGGGPNDGGGDQLRG